MSKRKNLPEQGLERWLGRVGHARRDPGLRQRVGRGLRRRPAGGDLAQRRGSGCRIG